MSQVRSSTRQHKPTQAALEERKRSLKAARSVACGGVTAKTNEIEAMRRSSNRINKEELQNKVDEWSKALEKLEETHRKYADCLTQSEKEKDAETWTAPVFNGFEAAKQSIDRFLQKIKATPETSESESVHVSDSVSATKSSRSQRSSRSSSSSIAIARADAAAKKAELLAKATNLKRKRALQEKAAKLKLQQQEQETKRKEEEARLQKEREEEERQRLEAEEEIKIEQEQLEVDEELAAADARLQALEVIDNQSSVLDQESIHIHEGDAVTTRLDPLAKEFKHDVTKTGLAESASPNADMMNLLAHQTQLSKMLIESQTKTSLPQRAIPVFDGNPLEYASWLSAFNHGVENRCSEAADRLFYLHQFTAGEVQKVVASYLRKDAVIGYREAKEHLASHYGNRHQIAEAYMNRAQDFPTIKSEDAPALTSFALFLTEYYNVMESLRYESELDHIYTIKMLVQKLPYKLRERWRTLTSAIHEQRSVSFNDLTTFVKRQAKISANPIYGDIKEVTSKPSSKHPRSHRVYATNTTTSDSERSSSSKGSPTSDKICVHCGKSNHEIIKCFAFAKLSVKEKLESLRQKGICFGCLKRDSHIKRHCKARMTCDKCTKNHPTVLHDDQFRQSSISKDTESAQPKKATPKTPGSKEPNESHVTASCVTGAGDLGCNPPIIPVLVRAKDSGVIVPTYAFLDEGSSAVFCTDDLRKKLKTSGRPTHLTVETLNQTKRVTSVRLDNLEIVSLANGNNKIQLPEVFAQPSIPVSKQDILHETDLRRWPHLAMVSIPTIDADIGLLIGNNVPKAMEPLRVINSNGHGPFACETMLGWVVHGFPTKSQRPTTSVNRIITAQDMDNMLINLYNHEFSERLSNDEPQMSKEDQMFINFVDSTTTRLQDQHYEVGLPLRNTETRFPNNKIMAEHRALHLKKKLVRDELFSKEYVAFMEGMVEKGYAERVPEDEIEGKDDKLWYIPHHGVYHPQKKKIRVVFDCAATFKGRSLNTELLQGPDLTNSLVGVLLRFREEPIALMADIEAMFHQVRIPKGDRDLLRFLWWPGGDVTSSQQDYRMTVHVFGATSSPACANYALRRTAEDAEDTYDAPVRNTVKSNFYVDDCLKSIADEAEAIQHVKSLTQLCSEGGFRLTKWMSNSRNVLQSIPKSERAKEVISLDLATDRLPMERALGVLWNAQSDSFGFNITIPDKKPTRRGILSMVSSIYDPLGFISPCTLPAKILMQDLCRLQLSWDAEIPTTHLIRWQKWVDELPQLQDFKLPRCVKPAGFEPVSTELHHFSDASEMGYGAVSYLRMTNEVGDIHCSMVKGKARVTPLKKISIPRLELTAATVSIRVDSMIRKELKLDDTCISCFWTDSTSVLRYIWNKTTRFHTFVANRVAVISEGSEPDQWRYVPTDVNPADDCSRGVHVDKFMKNDRWIKGPEFLYKDEDEWPNVNIDFTAGLSTDPEVKKMKGEEEVPEIAAKVMAVELKDENKEVAKKDPIEQLLYHYSSWYRLKRGVAWILKIKRRLKKLKQTTSDSRRLSTEDLDAAEIAIIQSIQRKAFSNEIQDLTKKSNIKMSSPIYRLDPTLDDDGILRVGGRLRRSAMPEESKHPSLLPKNHRVTQLILQEIHRRKGHVGRTYILSEFRKRFWAAGANSSSRMIINQCVVCRRQRGKVEQQKMANLPEDRVTPDKPPFTNVGVDYFGPFEAKRGRSIVKRYGVIFTCLCTRAIHIEMADSMDTDSCLNAIRRFIARRGQVKEIRSDNGTNFVGADRVLKAEIKSWNQAQIHDSLLQQNIKWIFNPPAASHFGGVWERQIRTIRKIMTSVLKEQTLNDDSLRTLFCEVEAIINGRPITIVTEDTNDLEALTPNHLLLMKSKPSLPPTVSQEADKYRRRWKQVQYMADLFWRRWTKEYLPQLQVRQKWNQVRANVKTGDIVLVVDNSAPRSCWPMGRILKVLPDKEGLVRSVEVRTKNGVYKRPISKLVMVLESDIDIDN